MTTKYCRPIDGGAKIDYAPDFIVNPDGSINHAPSRADYAAKEWWWNAIVAPYPPEGQVVKSTRYEVRGEGAAAECVAVYEYEPAPVIPRKFSKLKVEIYLARLGKLAAHDAFLDTTCIAGTNYALRRFYDQATNISEDHPMFVEYARAYAVALGMTEAELDQMLAECVWED